MSFVDILHIIIPSMIALAAPLIFTAIGGVFSERAGVVNIGLEGLMVFGAFTSIVFTLTFGSTFGGLTPWLAIVAAMVVGMLFSLLHAVASISFRADQTVSGVALNFLATGACLFLVKLMYDKGQTDRISVRFDKIDIPLLSDIPVVGKIFFTDVYLISYLAILVPFIVWYVLFKTPFGLRIRAVGEHPMAADTMGVNVTKIRYLGVVLSGAFAGIGGAVHAITVTNDFSHSTINGQGFMAIAAMIFGKWHPIGALGAALFFGLAQSLRVVGGSLPFFSEIPSVYLDILPYVLTIVALAGFIGRADAPKASGKPYIKGNR
ncbi:MAG: ABC transporter permease [Bacillus sp. (in: firmicutes)]